MTRIKWHAIYLGCSYRKWSESNVNKDHNANYNAFISTHTHTHKHRFGPFVKWHSQTERIDAKTKHFTRQFNLAVKLDSRGNETTPIDIMCFKTFSIDHYSFNWHNTTHSSVILLDQSMFTSYKYKVDILLWFCFPIALGSVDRCPPPASCSENNRVASTIH